MSCQQRIPSPSLVIVRLLGYYIHRFKISLVNVRFIWPVFILTILILPHYTRAGQRRDSLTAIQLYSRANIYIQKAKYGQADHILIKASTRFDTYGRYDLEAACYSRIAVNLCYTDRFDSARVYLRKSVETVKRIRQPEPMSYMGILSDWGEAERVQGHYDPAIQYFNEALRRYDSAPRDSAFLFIEIMMRKGSVLEDLGRYKASLSIYRAILPMALGHHFNHEIAGIYNNTGLLYRDMGFYDKALKYYRLSSAVSRSLFGDIHPDVGNSYNNIGGVYFQKGDYYRALDYFRHAMHIYLKTYGKDHETIAKAYNNIGVVYFYLNRKNKAAEFLKKSLDTKIKLLDTLNFNVATGYLNIGTIYHDQKEYGKALKYYHKSLSIKRRIVGDDNARMILDYENIAQVYEEQKQYERALFNLRTALNLSEHFLGRHHPTTGYEYIKLGELYRRMNQFPKAVSLFQQSLRALSPKFSDSSYTNNPDPTESRMDRYLLMALRDKGEALSESYRHHGTLEELKAAVLAYEDAAATVVDMRKSYRFDNSKLFLDQMSHDLYQNGIRASLELARQTGDSSYKQTALEFSEWCKSNVLMESILDSKAQRFSGIPDSLISEESRLRDKMTKLEMHLERSSPTQNDHISTEEDQLDQLKQRYNQFITKLEKSYPDYYHLKYNSPLCGLAFIRHYLLKPNGAIISYFLGDSSLYSFVITSNRFQISHVKAGNKLNREVRSMREGITQRDYKLYAQNARKLYAALIAPSASLIKGKHLTIIPDGILNYIPFGALLTKSVPGKPIPGHAPRTYRHLPYLMLGHSIRYAFSLALMDEIKNRRRPKSYASLYIGVAPVFDRHAGPYASHAKSIPDRRPEPLYDSEYEVKTIANLFRSSNGFLGLLDKNRTRILLRKQATEDRFETNHTLSVRYLHLATHAIVNEKNPDLSGILLTPDYDKKEDGILYSRDIYDLKLNADLVVLSACETALGKLVKGEGIIGLGRAFIYAGANNLLVSLWNINDRPTSLIMIRFYKNLIAGESLSSALHHAKMYLLHKTRFTSPQYWSPFILIGN